MNNLKLIGISCHIGSQIFNIDIKNGISHVNREFKYSATGFGRGS